MTILLDLPAYQDFPLNLHSIWGFWRRLLPNAKAWADRLYWFATLVGIAGFGWAMPRLKKRLSLLFAAAISLTLWATPHAMIYDWTLLLIPAILLWQDAPILRETYRPIYAMMWIAAFISGPLTRLQLSLLPLAIQFGVPAMLVATSLVYRWRINDHQAPDY